MCQAHARPAHARNHHHHTTTASLHPCVMAVSCVNQQPCTCTRNRAHPIDAYHARAQHRSGPVTSDRGRRSYTNYIFSISLLSPAPHAGCVVTHLPWPRRVLIAKCSNLLNLRIVRDVCTHARVCVRASACCAASCMQSQCERVKGLVHQRVVLTGRHDTPTLAPAGHTLLLEQFVARSLITGVKPIHILHPCMVICTRTSSTRTPHSPDSETRYMIRKLTHTHTAHAHAHAHSHHECRHTAAARVECKPFQS
jgi:hypothetical protein